LHRDAGSSHTNPKRKRGIFREFFPRLRFGLVFRLRNPCVNRSKLQSGVLRRNVGFVKASNKLKSEWFPVGMEESLGNFGAS